MHEASALAISSGGKGCGGNNRACIEKNVGGDGGETPAVVSEGAWVFDEDGNVVIGIRFGIATRARTVQHDAFNPFAVHLVKGGAEFDENWIVSCASALGHSGTLARTVLKTVCYFLLAEEIGLSARTRLAIAA